MAWGQNPCKDARYLKIWNTPYHKLSKREYDYYLKYEEKCSQWKTNKKNRKKYIISNNPKNIITNSPKVYKVDFVKVPMRDGANVDDEIIRFLYSGDKVIVHSNRKSWYLVEFFDDFGYVYGDALVQDSTNLNYFKNWNSIELNTGDKPPCYEENILIINTKSSSLRRLTDLEHINVKTEITLTILTPEQFEAIVQIIDITWHKTIKTSYINNGDSYTFRNIPDGEYQLKIATGKDLILKESSDSCELVFKTNPLYMITNPIEMKITNRIVDYGVMKRNEYKTPQFTLTLNSSRKNLLTSENSTQKIKNDFLTNERY